MFSVGKGEKVKEEKVYRRQDIVICKATENWYKEGRVVKVLMPFFLNFYFAVVDANFTTGR